MIALFMAIDILLQLTTYHLNSEQHSIDMHRWPILSPILIMNRHKISYQDGET